MLPKTLPTGHNCLWTSKTGSSAAGTFSYSRKTRSYQFPTTPTQLPNGFKPTKRNKLHYTTPTHNNSRLTHLNKRVVKTTCTSQQNCKDNQRLSRSFTSVASWFQNLPPRSTRVDLAHCNRGGLAHKTAISVVLPPWYAKEGFVASPVATDLQQDAISQQELVRFSTNFRFQG